MIRYIIRIFINRCLTEFAILYSIFSNILKFILNFQEFGYIKFGFCPLCGKKTFMIIERKKKRETSLCFFCSANSRNKALVEIIKKAIIIKLIFDKFDFFSLKGYFKKELNLSHYPLKTILNLIKKKEFSLYEPSSMSATYGIFKKFPNFIKSEYFPVKNIKSGQYVNGLLFQDLQDLSFCDNSFDIIITQDVFEHIKDPLTAFKEIYRVLKPFGFHIFTIPIENRKKTIKRIDKDNKILIKPIIYHRDNLRAKGPVVYNDFGYDLIKQLNYVKIPTFNIKFKKNPKLGIMDDIDIFISTKIFHSFNEEFF